MMKKRTQFLQHPSYQAVPALEAQTFPFAPTHGNFTDPHNHYTFSGNRQGVDRE